jgi:exodeoxyribonuclease VII small subunit
MDNNSEPFNYSKAIQELDEIAKKVEDPGMKLEEMEALIVKTKSLVEKCHNYLRSAQETIDKISGEEGV